METFSIIDATACGDEDRLQFLLEHGIEIFPINEQNMSTIKFPGIEHIFPRKIRIIFEVMEKIRSDSLGKIDKEITITSNQKQCILILLSEIADFPVTQKEINDSFNLASEYLQLNHLEDDTHIDQLRRLKRLGKLYLNYFKDFFVPYKARNVLCYIKNIQYGCKR